MNESKELCLEEPKASVKFDVGMTVIWKDSSYTIIDVRKRGVLLKQNFSIGTVLKDIVSYDELYLVNS